MSQFIESIRCYNGHLCLLEKHQKRIDQTFTQWGSGRNSLCLERILGDVELPQRGEYKIRVIYDMDGNFAIEFYLYKRTMIQDFELVDGSYINYAFKYYDRYFFEKLKSEAEAEEIIILRNNKLTDSSFSNMIFNKKGLWFTPKTYLLNGVQRQCLLESRQVQELEIGVDNLFQFSEFKMINAMNGFNDAISYPIEKIINLQNLQRGI